MKTTLRLAMTISSLIFSLSAFGQNYLGIYNSNYAGVMGTDLNPASFVDGRYSVDVNLGSFGIAAWQNAQTFTTVDMPKWWIKSFKSDPEGGPDNPHNDWMEPSDDFADNYLTRNYQANDGKTHGVYNNLQIDAANFMFHINREIAVGAAIKVRSITNLDDVNSNLALLMELDYLSDSSDLAQFGSLLHNQQFDEGLFNLNHMTWAEYGLIYSQVLKDADEHYYKIGGKLKWLSGIASAYVHTDNFSYNVSTDSTYSYLKGDVSYGHSTNLDAKMEQFGDGSFSIGDFLGSESKFGIGADIGFIYEWRPDWKEYKYDMDGEKDLWRRDKNKYKLRAGLSILDIGGMKFAKGSLSRDFSVNTNKVFDFREAFDPVESIEDVDSVFNYYIENDPDWVANEDVDETYFMALPTSVNLQFDYHIWEWAYLNFNGTIGLQNRKNPHRVRVPNQFSITPAIDHEWFGLYFPFSYNKYSSFRAGVASRLGPITIGFNDWGVLFASGLKKRGAQVFLGLRVPVLYGHPSDVDGDFVSDDLDECLVVPGLWEFKGCPDSDRDGIKDLDDFCPQEPGLAEFNGCPDKDGDKIPDKDDNCPDLPGDIAFGGCPDTDHDSIIDPQDDCPEIPGLRAFKGCPDSDGDGIKDEDDACPEVPGPLVNNGCPDTDNDGLFDFIDNCPEVPGPKENNGCPWPDTDEDGILDKDDACPMIPGPKANNGCPYIDTDGDGVLDKDDECPSTPGTVANKGCPEIEKEVEEILKTAFENLEFETAKDIIKEASKPSLTELAEVLVKKPEWRLQIAGHTDNVGNDQANLILSKKRAEAVRNFMVEHGIAADRLVVLYFGETMPIASNDTPEGRQKNRRVEMTIIFN